MADLTPLPAGAGRPGHARPSRFALALVLTAAALPLAAQTLVSYEDPAATAGFPPFDPTAPAVREAYVGPATGDKRAAALRGLNRLQVSSGNNIFGGGFTQTTIDGSVGPFVIGGLLPTVPVWQVLQVATDADLGLPGAAVTLDGALLRSGADIVTPRDFLIGLNGGVIDTNGFTLQIDGAIQADGTLIKQGAGVLAVTGNNVWNAMPFVHAGVLQGDAASLATAIDTWAPLRSADPTDQLGYCDPPLPGCPAPPAFFVVPTDPPVAPPVVEFRQELDGSYGETIFGGGTLRKTGGGTLFLTALQGYGGGTDIRAGTLALLGEGRLGSGGLQIAAGAVFDVAGALPVAQRPPRIDGLSGAGTVRLGAADLAIVLAADASFAGRFEGTGRVLLDGVGRTFSLTGPGDFAGTLAMDEVSAMRLALVGAGQLGSRATLILDGGLDIAAADGDRELGRLSGSGEILLGANRLTIGGNDAFSVFDGQISGSGGLTKTGSGEFVMAGEAHYTGVTRILGGTFTTTPLGLSSRVENHGTLSLDDGVPQFAVLPIADYSGDISGSGNLVKTGVAVLWLRGNNSFTGGTRVDSGALIGNTASLPGDIDVAAGAYLGFYQVADGVHAGNISGAGELLKYGPGRLTLSGTNSHRGGTLVGGDLVVGSDASLGDPAGALVLSDGTLVLAGDIATTRPVAVTELGGGVDTAGFDLELQGALSGSGRFEKRGAGSLSLADGAAFDGGLVEVSGGRLVLDGPFGQGAATLQTVIGQGVLSAAPGANVVSVHPGAELELNGPVRATVVNRGRLSRGGQIGVTEVVGDLVFGPGSTFAVRADATGAADRLALSGPGAVALLEGGRVAVAAADGAYRARTDYAILSAPGGVQGRFAAVDTDLAFLTPGLNYTGGTVTLSLNRNDLSYAAVGRTPTERQVGESLTAMAANPTADVATLLGEFEGMTAPAAGAALRAMAGPATTGAFAAGALAQRGLARAATGRLAGLGGQGGSAAQTALARARLAVGLVDRAGALGAGVQPPALAALPGGGRRGSVGGHGLWGSGFGGSGEIDADAGAGAAEYRVRGVLFGYDRAVGRHSTVGVLAGYADRELTLRAPDGEVDTRSWQIGLYGRYGLGEGYLDGFFSYARDGADSVRPIQVGALSQRAVADYDGSTLGAYVEAGRDFGGTHLVQPYVALHWIEQRHDAYAEQGAGALNLVVDGRSDTSVRSIVGVRVSRAFAPRSARAGVVAARLGWAHEFADGDARAARLAGDPTGASFLVSGRELPRDSAVLGAGIAVTGQRDLTLYADVEGEVNREQHSIGVAAGLRYAW